jgi:hypothetical protein
MSNILEVPHQQAIQAMIAKGWSVRRIGRGPKEDAGRQARVAPARTTVACNRIGENFISQNHGPLDILCRARHLVEVEESQQQLYVTRYKSVPPHEQLQQ